MNRTELVNLDVNKLFEERSVDEIIEIEKLLDAEIDKKRNDLRSMVGLVFSLICTLSCCLTT